MAGRKLLLIGATGVFGGRLARQLAGIEEIALVVASRDGFGLRHLSRSSVTCDDATLAGDRRLGSVRVAGLDAEGTPARSQWSLIAERDDAPNVPTLATVAAVRAMLAGRGVY